MGICNPYFPKEIALKMAAKANAKVFVETGTFMGNTTKWAAKHFEKVYTIELAEYYYNLTKDDLLSKGNISPMLGNSKTVLPEILKELNGNTVFWLDGHYSAGLTAGVDDPCPLLEELDIILRRNNDDIILIDDARCYSGMDKLYEGWPLVATIYDKITGQDRTGQDRTGQIIGI